MFSSKAEKIYRETFIYNVCESQLELANIASFFLV